MEIYVPSLKHRIEAVFWKWFCEYLTTELAAVHNYNTAEYGPNALKMIQLEVGEDPQKFHGIDITNVLRRRFVDG